MSEHDFDYDDLLDKNWDDLPEPVDLPVGDWVFVGISAPRKKEPKEGTKMKRSLVFPMRAVSPGEDFDRDLLEELPDDFDPSDTTVFHEIIVEKPSDMVKNVKPFLESIGLDTSGGVRAALDAFKDHEFVAHHDWRTFQVNGEDRRDHKVTRFRQIED